jgi:molybdopterin converting factor small subunit
MVVKVYLFGQLKELTGSSELLLEGIADTDQLVKEMKSRFPKIGDLPYLVAVDKALIHSNTILEDGQQLALLPPYSGG